MNGKCSYCNSTDFIGYHDLQNRLVYPRIPGPPNTNGHSCAPYKVYVDVNNKPTFFVF